MAKYIVEIEVDEEKVINSSILDEGCSMEEHIIDVIEEALKCRVIYEKGAIEIQYVDQVSDDQSNIIEMPHSKANNMNWDDDNILTNK